MSVDSPKCVDFVENIGSKAKRCPIFFSAEKIFKKSKIIDFELSQSLSDQSAKNKLKKSEKKAKILLEEIRL